MADTNSPQRFEALLEHLHNARGIDFSGYKRASVLRRILKRMHDVRIEDFGDYMDYLEVHPEEFTQLFDTILINVTSFFRDPPAWDYVAHQLIPSLLAQKPASQQFRVWSAGCASGEEPYTIAMLLHEALGGEQFRQRVKIYATDIDEDALNRARQGAYSAKEMEAVPPAFRDRYFQPVGSRHVFNTDLRRSIIFGRHDLLQHAPISRLDVLICRNTLMYFNADVQSTILARLHFALNDTGCLFLGKAEMLLTHHHLFRPLELKYRIFAKVPRGVPRERSLSPQAQDTDALARTTREVRLRDVAFDTAPVAQVMVNPGGALALANQHAFALFGLSPSDIGRPFHDLEISYRPVELRSIIDQAVGQHRAIVVGNVEYHRGHAVLYVDVQAVPLTDDDGTDLGVSITFNDITQSTKLREDLRHAHAELETAHEELQSSNEELETTNEELQSSNEELETTNEELQSANEELETMNEELQSSNEELQTLNDELHQRSDDISHINAFLDSILTGVRAAVVVVDENLKVELWNRTAEDLWGLRAEEVQHKPLLSLDVGLPMDQVKSVLSACMNGDGARAESIVNATNRRGRPIRCSIAAAPRLGTDRKPHGVILLIEDVSTPAEGDGK